MLKYFKCSRGTEGQNYPAYAFFGVGRGLIRWSAIYSTTYSYVSTQKVDALSTEHLMQSRISCEFLILSTFQ
jgi:hypothetical protein